MFVLGVRQLCCRFFVGARRNLSHLESTLMKNMGGGGVMVNQIPEDGIRPACRASRGHESPRVAFSPLPPNNKPVAQAFRPEALRFSRSHHARSHNRLR